MESSRLYALLRGTWEFARVIRSTTDPSFSVSGVATFVAAAAAAAASSAHAGGGAAQRSLRYTERGVMRQEQAAAPASLPPLPPMDVKAEHVWHFPPAEQPPGAGAACAAADPQAAATAHVHFADGRHFFTLALPELHCGQSSARFTHLCDPDTYTGSLLVEAPPGAACRLTLAWAISGPKKSTEIRTTFFKLPEERAGEAAGGGGGSGSGSGSGAAAAAAAT